MFLSIQSSLLWVKLTILNMVRVTARSGIEGERMIALSVRCRKEGDHRSSVPLEPKCGGRRSVTTVQPHAIWALAWSSNLVSLRCRCRRTADGTRNERARCDFSTLRYERARWIFSTLGSSTQMGGWRLRTYSRLRISPGGHITSLGDLAKRPHHNLSVSTSMVCIIPKPSGGHQDEIVSCG